MAKHYRKENNCLNCGTTLQGHFCHNCGQENLEVHESFGHVMNHTISDYFHFDHQFFGTLRPLLFKPGFLTNEYFAGRRVKYLHPVKMYIFISVLYFLLAFNLNVQNKGVVQVHVKPTAGLIAQNTPTTQSEVSPIDRPVKKPFETADSDTSYSQYLTAQSKLPAEKRDGFWGRLYNEKIYAYKAKYGNRAIEVFVEEVEHNFPKMMFFVLPMFALILMIAFRKNHKYYVEHLIFSFHYYCFVFLFLSAALLVLAIIPATWNWAIGLLGFTEFAITTIYFYKALRVVYNRRPFRTVTKMVGVSVANAIVTCVCVVALVVVTALISG
jgi:hypothetical protein